MKRVLSLALSFVVCCPGLVSLCAGSARAQEVAAAVTVEKLREQYERLLAVERDPATPPEVRELNHSFLEERRAQLASALRERIGALRKYQAGVVSTLGEGERLAVEDSIQKLVNELQALEPTPASEGRPSRVAPKSARQKRVVPASLNGAAAAVHAPAPSPAPDSDPKPARPASPIEITSPDRDKTVRVGQVEVEVSVGDEDIDDIMVALYTQRSGQKPATARTLELKRSDHGKKTIPLALEEGTNRIEVSDLKRGEVLTTRTLTYKPTSDVLNAAPQEAATALQPVEGLVVKRLKAVQEGQAVVCGQLQLASLNRTFALIRSTAALGDLAARFRPAVKDPRTGQPAEPRRRFEDQIPVRDDESQDFLVTSQISDTCQPRSAVVPNDGLQRSAAIDLLRAVLLRLDANLQPKDIPVNTAAFTDETNYILETTTTSKSVRGVARSSAPAAARNGSRALPQRSSAFSSLSADTIRKQIVLLEEYLGNVEVTLKGEDKTYQTFTDRDGNFVFVIPFEANADPEKFTLSTEGDQNYTTREVTVGRGERVRVNLGIEDRPVSLLARTILGYDQSGAAAAKHEQNYFFDFFVSKSFPFRQKINPDFGERLKIWGDFRINSVPQTGDVSVGDFAGGGFTTAAAALKVKDIARVFEVLGGLEYRLTGNNALLPSFDRQTKQKFSLSLIGAYGILTPLDPLENAPKVFKVLEGAEGLPPAAKGKEFVAFVPVDRDRFFRQYYAGLRVQTFFFNKYNVPIQRFPAQFDLTVGQNEFVTGGRMHGPVIRMESFFPLPYDKAKFINLFATAQMIPGRAKIGTPLVLQEAPTGTTVPAANIALVGVPQPNRDHYRIGIGIDFIPFFQKLVQPKTSGGAAGSAGGGATPANNNGNGRGETPSPND